MKTKAFAAINLNEAVRLGSSSGGMYSVLAEHTIRDGGVVFAAVYNENMHVEHVKIGSIDEIEKSRGAKYVYSDFSGAVKEAGKMLEDGHKVMFVGNPCQCAAMLEVGKNYRDNLLCVDFVCHGTPDKKIWEKYLDALEKRYGRLVALNMRCKDTGWSNYSYCWKMTFENGKKLIQPQGENPYMIGFTRDYYLRSACYNCSHKGFSRKTDFTLGDFWGVWDLKPDMDDNKGTSLLLVHTDKAMSLLEELSPNLKMVEITEQEATKQNRSIISSSKKNEKAKLFEDSVAQGQDFISVMTKLEGKSFVEKVKNKIKRLIKRN